MTSTFSSSGLLLLLLAALLVFGCLWAVSPAGQAMLAKVDAALQLQTIYSSHPVEKRGLDQVEKIRTCINNGGTMQAWYNPQTFRSALLCQPDDRYAIQIVRFSGNIKREITGFFKEKCRTLESVERYLHNRGYLRLGSPEFEAWKQANPKLFESSQPFFPPAP